MNLLMLSSGTLKRVSVPSTIALDNFSVGTFVVNSLAIFLETGDTVSRVRDSKTGYVASLACMIAVSNGPVI